MTQAFAGGSGSAVGASCCFSVCTAKLLVCTVMCLALTSSFSFFSQALIRTRGSLSNKCRRCVMAWTTCSRSRLKS